MFEKNRILQMLEQNQIPLGMQCFTGDPILIEIMGLTGFGIAFWIGFSINAVVVEIWLRSNARARFQGTGPPSRTNLDDSVRRGPQDRPSQLA